MSGLDGRETPTVGGALAAAGKAFGTAAGISVLGAAVEYASPVAVARFADGATGAWGWVPTFGSLGETVLVYSTVTGVAGPLLTVLLSVAFGLVAGGRFAVESDYREFLALVAAGSLSAVTVVFGALVVTGGDVSLLAGHTLVVLVGFYLELVVGVTAVVLTGAFAGAALSQFGGG